MDPRRVMTESILGAPERLVPARLVTLGSALVVLGLALIALAG
jgi:hypothetical protein